MFTVYVSDNSAMATDMETAPQREVISDSKDQICQNGVKHKVWHK